MLNCFRRRLTRVGKEEQGFTIVELLVVMTVVGILAGIGVSGYANFRARAYKTAADAAWRDLQVAINLHEIEKGPFPRNSQDGSTTNREVEDAIKAQLEPTPPALQTNLWNNGLPATDNNGVLTDNDRNKTGFVVATVNSEDITCVWVNGFPSQFNHALCK